MYAVSNVDDVATLTGMADFLKILLDVTAVSQQNTDKQQSTRKTTPFVTKEILLASIWHYAESIAARKQGVLDQDFVRKNVLAEASGKRNANCSTSSPRKQERAKVITTSRNTKKVIPILRSGDEQLDSSGFMLPIQAKPIVGSRPLSEEEDDNNNDYYRTHEVWKIARGAAQIKRAEVLARAVNEKSAPAVLTEPEASRIRGLLLTVNDFDWRSLMLRCVACLYRLEGIDERQSNVLRRSSGPPAKVCVSTPPSQSSSVSTHLKRALKIEPFRSCTVVSIRQSPPYIQTLARPASSSSSAEDFCATAISVIISTSKHHINFARRRSLDGSAGRSTSLCARQRTLFVLEKTRSKEISESRVHSSCKIDCEYFDTSG